MCSVMDCISKEEPSPSAHPSSSKSPHPLPLSVPVTSILNLYFTEEGSVITKMFYVWRWITLDIYRLCNYHGHRSFLFVPFYILVSVCVCVCTLSSQVILLVLLVHE